MDEPGGRKIHPESTPRGAGIVLWLGYMIVALFFGGSEPAFRFTATGATIVFFAGYIDDMHPLPSIWRLSVHLAAAVLVVAVTDLDLPMRLVLLLWIAGCTNAFNLIDGLNGLSISLASVTAVAGFAATGRIWWVFLFCLAMGALYWNYPRARTFLGDGGSTLLGFLVSAQFALSFPADTGGTVPVAQYLVALVCLGGVPVVDTLYSMFRRILRGQSPFSPDRGHIHHILLAQKLPQSAILLILVSAQALMAGIALFLPGSPFYMP